MTAAPERPAGRLACGARPAGARPDRTTPAASPQDEYQRLLSVGVSPAAALILAAGRTPRRDDERAYRQRLRRGLPPTPEQRAANAAAERDRRYLRRSA